MHHNILTDKQRQLLTFVSKFRKNYYLVGGTAIALHIGHRTSIDFDLFTQNKINKSFIKKEISKLKFNKQIIFEDIDQLHLLINDVKTTFFLYPYSVNHNEVFNRIITVPSLLSLSAMKAFALGRRAKWKDYVDLFFIIKNYYSIKEISIEAVNIFGELFSEKLFRGQIAFHDDIDYSEPVEYIKGYEILDKEIKQFLIEKSIEI